MAAVGKSSSELHFCKSATITFILSFSGVLHLAQPSLTGGRWQADEIQMNFEIFKIGCRLKYSTCSFV